MDKGKFKQDEQDTKESSAFLFSNYPAYPVHPVNNPRSSV
jgi:hypothetical protein